MPNNERNKLFVDVRYNDWPGVPTEEKIVCKPFEYPTVKWDAVAYSSASSPVSDTIAELINKHISEKLQDELTTNAAKNNNQTKTENKKKNKTKESTMNEMHEINNVLFLAPGYQYAMSVINNQSKELDRKKIPYTASKDPKNLYIRTDKVHVEIVYMDPVKWTSALFQKRDAVFGKKELVDKACENFFHSVIAPTKSLSKYIREAHSDSMVAEPVKPRETYIPEIKNTYFNDPVTVVIWEDGTKTMVKCQEGDVYSAETGLALCIAKKALGNMPNFNNVFRKWIPEEKTVDIPVNLEIDGFKIGAGVLYQLKETIENHWKGMME